ncbi:hypothetical protein ACFVU2_09640 [Leifsonia sp. NPDC058194]|uniref:hypothetical protein n=1 Tax=Leifsonia sp. NPDC058194 TaxID=3346374 RepID=UPI0036D999EE
MTEPIRELESIVRDIEGEFADAVAGPRTFDGYDDPDRGADWALGVVRDVARLGLRTERRTRWGVPWGSATVLGAEPGDAAAVRSITVVRSWTPWILTGR